MPETANRGTRLIAWIGRFRALSPARRWLLGLLVLAVVLLIGIFDYWTGPHASLSFFYLIPVALAVPWLGWRSALGVGTFAGVVRIAADSLGEEESAALSAFSWWNAGLMLLIFALVIWLLHALLELYDSLEQRVQERTKQLEHEARARQQLERELLEVGSRERAAIGHELHDDLCQHLVGTALAAKVLAERSDRHQAEALSIVNWLEEGIAKTRRIARGLLLAQIAPEALPTELKELAATLGAEQGIVCRFEQVGEMGIRDAAVAAQLFRIAQEAVRNAARHSGATSVIITLSSLADTVELAIEDDGSGFAGPRARGEGMGLRVMAHRAAMMGGRLAIDALNPRGTRIVCTLPRERRRP